MEDAGSHPSVEEIKQSVQSKGGTLACLVCGRDEFMLEEVTVLGPGMKAYGAYRIQRAQMVCENCGSVVNFDLSRLLADSKKSQPPN